MADLKVTTMVLKVDLQCRICCKKIKKILAKFPQIQSQTFDEKANTVTITVVCSSPEKFRDELCCKGRKVIKCIEIKAPPKPKPPDPPKPKDPPPPPPKPKDPPPPPPKPQDPPPPPPKPKDPPPAPPTCIPVLGYLPMYPVSACDCPVPACGCPVPPPPKPKDPPPPPPKPKDPPPAPPTCIPGLGYLPMYPVSTCDHPVPACGHPVQACDHPVPACDRPCYCGYGVPAPSYDRYGGYGYGCRCGCSGTRGGNVSRCDHYFSEENATGCTIM